MSCVFECVPVSATASVASRALKLYENRARGHLWGTSAASDPPWSRRRHSVAWPRSLACVLGRLRLTVSAGLTPSLTSHSTRAARAARRTRARHGCPRRGQPRRPHRSSGRLRSPRRAVRGAQPRAGLAGRSPRPGQTWGRSSWLLSASGSDLSRPRLAQFRFGRFRLRRNDLS